MGRDRADPASHRRAISLGVRGEDNWGNATDQIPAGLTVMADREVKGLPKAVTITSGARGASIDGLCIDHEGEYRFSLLSPSGEVLAVSTR